MRGRKVLFWAFGTNDDVIISRLLHQRCADPFLIQGTQMYIYIFHLIFQWEKRHTKCKIIDIFDVLIDPVRQKSRSANNTHSESDARIFESEAPNSDTVQMRHKNLEL
jgi:hypothetical protein